MNIRLDNGSFPVVTVLGEEKYERIPERVDAIGGSANVFIDLGDRISRISIESASLTKNESESPEYVNPSGMSVAEFFDELSAHNGHMSVPRDLDGVMDASVVMENDNVLMDAFV